MSTAPCAAPLSEVFATVADPRGRFGRSSTLASLLTPSAVAVLCGCRSLHAIARWGRDYNHLAPPGLRVSRFRPPEAANPEPPGSHPSFPRNLSWKSSP